MKIESQDAYLLSSVKNALRVLQSFSIDNPEKKVTELAKDLKLGKSTVSRLLATLASEGFVTKDSETQRYRLGLSILNLNTIITSHLEVTRESALILKELVNEINETAHIAVLEDDNIVYLNRIDCKQPVQILSHIGRRNPLHCTSSGKILLAHQSQDFIDSYIDKGLEAYTPKTVTSQKPFKEFLQSVKEQGYSVSKEELRVGVCSLAAPIKDYTGKVVYALSVVGPVHRMNPSNEYLIRKVKKTALEISESLGYWKR
ncbi:IclR family transcriptional regulator [Bacillus massiliglaciei]|uniref:IclR family transcriptional regulator n=1 Tax=Bacillus massiliglaciei TaxID=1816693 RepID=UPI000DA63AFD|nr:IclR family transcriptional regulator [Bacillus massiliglaciei]